MSFDDLYRQNILDHYQNPRNFGTLEHPDISAEDSNPLCGDEIRIDLKVKDGVIEDVRFSGKGCSISRAAASMLTEEIRGKTLEEVKRIGRDDVLEMLGIELGPVRLKCALLALKTLKVGVYGVRGWPGDDEEDR
jgi:nitrogen fixation NifU-like protein